MFKKTKKLTLSDLAGSFGESENKKSRSLCSYQAENKKNRVNIGRKIKYWFSSENKEAAQHLLVIFGVLVLILLSCAAINKVENGMNFQGKQAMVESVWGGGTAETAKNEEKKAIKMLKKLYTYYIENPDEMSAEYRQLMKKGESKAQVVCDYLAGMTDQYSMAKFRKIYIPKAWEVY